MTRTGWSTDVITDLTINFMKERNADKPFFLMCHYKSTHDPLTGLRNRLGMEEALEKRIEHLGTGTDAFALLLIDIADFRYYNDTLGYEVGDELVKLISQKLNKTT